MTPESRIEDLEYRLERYHEWLAEAIDERDRLALNAAWGVHLGLYLAVLSGIICALMVYAFHSLSGWTALLTAVGIVIVSSIVERKVFGWSNGGRMKEIEGLAKLPEWERRI